MPAAGERVTFVLRDKGDSRLTGTLALADEVIVIPVNVHVFRPESGEVDSTLAPERVFTWFERPAFYTTKQNLASGTVPGVRESIVTREIYRQTYINVDEVWHAAGIQFALRRYNVIDDSDLERRVVGSLRREFRVSGVHARYRDEPGLHIYVGRNGNSPETSAGTKGGDAWAPRCAEGADTRFAIALAWDRARQPGRPLSYVLAHEIGHLLGLEHTNESARLACGAPLLDAADDAVGNLMSVHAGRGPLSAGQIERARAVACGYLSLWGISSRACPRP